ncbi:hypothetical protein C0585_08430 [Candidatus Woesearchaeota archaeon]|nr:MAG: hypothetical protein C0585_08430 [Candidatus Woesearchaeota archaeon]
MTRWKYQGRLFTPEEPRKLVEELHRSSSLRHRRQEVTDTYVVGDSQYHAKARGSELKILGIKGRVCPLIMELRDDRHYGTVRESLLDEVLSASDAVTERKGHKAIEKALRDEREVSISDLAKYTAARPGMIITDISKISDKFESGDLEAEVTKAMIGGEAHWTVAFSGNNSDKLYGAMREYGFPGIQAGVIADYAGVIRSIKR